MSSGFPPSSLQPKGKGMKTVAEATEGLKELMFDPKLSIERFRNDFETPREMLGLVQSLLVVVMQTSPPPPPPSGTGSGKDRDDGAGSAYSLYWERFVHHMGTKKAAGGSLLDRLFDFLDALAPSPCASSCFPGQVPGDGRVLVGCGERSLLLNVEGMGLEGVGGGGEGGRIDARMALCEALNLQAEVLQTIAGVLAASYRAIVSGRALDIEGWHADLGLFQTIASRLLASEVHSLGGGGGGSAPTLLERLDGLGGCMGRDGEWSEPGGVGEDALVRCLRGKVKDAVRLVVLSSVQWPDVQHGNTGGAGWSGGCEIPGRVLLPLLVSRFLVHVGTSEGRMETEGGGGEWLLSKLLQLAKGSEWGGGGGGEVLRDQGTAEVVFRGLETVGAMCESGWLLSRVTNQAGMPWINEWDEVMHTQARKDLFKAVGCVCVSLRHMQAIAPLEFSRLQGALLRMCNEALSSVLHGWDELLLLQPSLEVLRGNPQPPPVPDSFQGGFLWLMATVRQMRAMGEGNSGRMHSVLMMGEVLGNMDAGSEMLGVTPGDFGSLLLNAGQALCMRLPQLDIDVRRGMGGGGIGREVSGPHWEVGESLETILFCLRYMEQAADMASLERALGGQLSTCLSRVAVLSITQYLCIHSQAPPNTPQGHRIEGVRADWQGVCASALECIGCYVWHAEVSGAHQLAVQMVSLVTGHLDSAALVSLLTPGGGGGEGGLSVVFAHVIQGEEADEVGRMPITKGIIDMTQRMFDAFQKHFGAKAGLQDDGVGGGNLWTNAAVALSQVEDACQDLSKLQRCEWRTAPSRPGDGNQPLWGWYKGHPAASSSSSPSSTVAFHLLEPFIQVLIPQILPLSARLRAAWSAPEGVGLRFDSYEGYSMSVLAAERSRDALSAFSSLVRLIERLVSDQVLILSLLRNEIFLGTAAPNMSQSVHVGCAGIQDRPDLFLTVLHMLEREAGPVTHLLKLMETRRAEGGSQHRGLDSAMANVLGVLRRVLLYRCDPHVSRNTDMILERSCLQLAPVAVACMCLSPRSLSLPSLVLDDDVESVLGKEASRFLSVLCRVDLQPYTIRHSWAQCRRELAQLQRRTLLEIATDSEAPVDSRASVLAFLSEALLSQPGLADWLFEDDSDRRTIVGRADAASSNSMTLDSSSSKEDGFYKGWLLEIRGGKGIGQPPRVIKSYSGATREAKLSAPWDDSIPMPDSSSQYTLCRQLQLRRVVKAFLHPDFAYNGGAIGSEKEANRLKVVQHTLMLVQTIWDSVPEERESVVQGFCDADCLIFGLESPHDAEVLNETSRWRTYNVRMFTQGGKRDCKGVFAAPGEPLIQQGRKGQDSESGKKLSLTPPAHESKALGWLKSSSAETAGSTGFWQAVSRWVLGAPDDLVASTYIVDGNGCTTVRCKMPSSLLRQPLPLLDGAKSNSAVIRVLASQETLERIMRGRRGARGRLAREVWEAMGEVSNDRDACVDRVRAELRLVDWCMQSLEKDGYDRSESADAALELMWERLGYGLLFTDMDGERERLLRPVPLPYMLRNYIYASVVSTRTGSGGNDDEEIVRLFENPQGPLTYAVDSQCRRMHIEACAVSIAAIHLEQDPLGGGRGGGGDGQADAEAKQRKELVTKVAGKAVRVLCGMKWAGINEVSDEHVLLDSEAEFKDGPPLELLRFVQRVAFVVPPGQEGLSQSQQVEAKLASICDFSEEWHLDSRRAGAMCGNEMEEIAQAINRDKAVDDLSSLLAASYCRFLDAAASACPKDLLAALDQNRSGQGQVQRCPLNPLLIALARVLPAGAANRDLQVASGVARTLSMLVHMAWPLHPTRQELFPAIPAPLLLASLSDALSAATQSEKRLPRPEQAAERWMLCESMLDCGLRLLLYLHDMRATLDTLSGASGGAGDVLKQAADLLGSADKDPALLVRLSAAVGNFMREQRAGGLVARKCCAILALLVRVCPWTEGHWEALLDHTFWTHAPGVLRWVGGGIEGMPEQAQGHKEAGLDALAALELIVEVAKREQGAQLLSSNGIMTFLRQGMLHAKVTRKDAHQLRYYIASGAARHRNRWHEVWCHALQTSHVLTVQLSHLDSHMSELVAFAVTYTNRLTRVLTVTCDLYRDSSISADAFATSGEPGSGGFVAGMRPHGLSANELIDAELGRVPSLAVLEEARQWSALLLRLAHRLNVWAPHVPLLSRVVVELVPEVVGSLTYILNLWGSDTSAFERRLQPVSEQEKQQARTVCDPSTSEQRPCDLATSVLDLPIQAAIRQLATTFAKDSRSRSKLQHQRCVYNQRLLDTLLSLLHNCLRILCACGEQVRPHIERSMSRWGAGTISSLPDLQVAHTSLSSSPRRVGCSLGTIVAAAEAAVSYLSFVSHVEWACENDTSDAVKVRGGQWQEEVGALQHRRAMLLRLVECAGLLLGRFAGDVDIRDACRDLVMRLKSTCTTPPNPQAGASSKGGKQREADLDRTLIMLRTALRTVFETL